MSWKEQLKNISETLPQENKVKIIDSHAHYDTIRFQKDKDELLKKLTNSNEIIINCGTKYRTNQSTIKLCEDYDFIYGVIGYFPSDCLELEQYGLKTLRKMLGKNKIIGIGEIGLDYHWNCIGFGDEKITGDKARQIQQKWFIEQLKLANELKMPVCIHSRDAEEDTYNILNEYTPEYGCVIHCYSYGLESAKKYVDKGFYFGVGGKITYNDQDLLAAVNYIPIEQILLETDCPYLTPEPNRHSRNDSSKLIYVAEKLAEIKDISVDKVIEITNANTKKLYNIK